MAAKPAKTVRPREEPKTLLKADSVNVALAADKEGRIRVNAASFETPAVVLPGQVLEIRWERGQVVMVKRELKK